MSQHADGFPAADRTRDCLDPWTMALVKVDGTVSLCCWGRPVGKLSESSLQSVVTGPRAREVREQLLRGNLQEDCLRCPGRGWSTPSRLRERLQAFQRAENERRAMFAHAAALETELGRWKVHAMALQHDRDQLSQAMDRSLGEMRAHRAYLERALSSGPTGWWRRATGPLKRVLRRVLPR
jgi:hypothetical protein